MNQITLGRFFSGILDPVFTGSSNLVAGGRIIAGNIVGKGVPPLQDQWMGVQDNL